MVYGGVSVCLHHVVQVGKCTQILNMHRYNEIAVCRDGACPVSTNKTEEKYRICS